MDSRPDARSNDNMPIDPEKIGVWVSEHSNGSQQGEPLLQNAQRRQGASSAISKFRHGIWLAILEVSFVIFGFYGVLRQGGVLDSAKDWLAHPTAFPEEPIRAFGYQIKVKEPRSDVPTFSNNSRM